MNSNSVEGTLILLMVQTWQIRQDGFFWIRYKIELTLKYCIS